MHLKSSDENVWVFWNDLRLGMMTVMSGALPAVDAMNVQTCQDQGLVMDG